MELFASFNGPSEERFFLAMIVAGMASIIAGFFVRHAVGGFFVGGFSAALVTFAILGSARGDLVGLVTMFYTLIFGFVGGFLGGIAAVAGKALKASANKEAERADRTDRAL